MKKRTALPRAKAFFVPFLWGVQGSAHEKEHGMAMLSAVFNGERAIGINIAIMRIFFKLRKMQAGNKPLAAQLENLERRIGEHGEAIRDIVTAIREMASPSISNKSPRMIGFHP